jgi:hypothetical protein
MAGPTKMVATLYGTILCNENTRDFTDGTYFATIFTNSFRLPSGLFPKEEALFNVAGAKEN